MSSILSTYDAAFKECFSKINFISRKLETRFNLREENIFGDKHLHYIIELIKIKSNNQDDYGMDINFKVDELNDVFNIEIDVSKATGQIYFDRSFKIDKNRVEDKDEQDIVNKSLMWIKGLPEKVIAIFEKDYL